MIRRIAVVAAFAAPLAVLAAMLLRAVNVPFLDEWSWAALALAARDGTLTWSDIAAQHNEHRNVVANLVFLAIDRTIGWNVLAEQLVSFAVLLGGQAAAWILVRETTEAARRRPLFAVLSVLLWSFAQWENFALGYNLGWNVCTTALLVLLAALAVRVDGPRFAAAAAAAFVATFASAQGALLWPIGVALLLSNAPRRGAALSAWAALAAATLVAFLHGYAAPASAAAPPPATAAFYFFTVLGTPVGAWWGVGACAAVGALAVAAFAWTVSRPAVEGRVRLVWSCAAFYAFAGAAVIAGGRWTFGPESALASHYAAIALFAFAAVAGLAAAGWEQIARAPRWALVAAGVLAAYGVLDADLHGNRAWQLYALARRAVVCALATHDDAALATLADADVAWVERQAAALAAANDLPYRGELARCMIAR
jgi:MFS family permease